MGAPVRGRDGRVVGALDASTAAQDGTPDRLGLVIYAAGLASAELAAGRADATAPPPAATRLTRREQQVLQLAAEGHDRRGIGRRLQISPRTAEAHRTRALRKLGLRTRVDLVGYAVAHGLLGRPRTT